MPCKTSEQRGKRAAVEVAHHDDFAWFAADFGGGVRQIGAARGGQLAIDGRRRMQGVNGGTVGQLGADIGEFLMLPDVAGGQGVARPDG